MSVSSYVRSVDFYVVCEWYINIDGWFPDKNQVYNV